VLIVLSIVLYVYVFSYEHCNTVLYSSWSLSIGVTHPLHVLLGQSEQKQARKWRSCYDCFQALLLYSPDEVAHGLLSLGGGQRVAPQQQTEVLDLDVAQKIHVCSQLREEPLPLPALEKAILCRLKQFNSYISWGQHGSWHFQKVFYFWFSTKSVKIT